MLSVPLSPAPVPLMSRRVPLGSIQHNALSPLKTTSTVPAKRPANSSRDVAGSRPTKKPYIDGTAGLSYTSLDQKENRASMTTKTVPRTPSRHDGRRDGPASRIARPKATLTGSHHPPPVFQHDKIDPLSKVKKNVVQAKQSTEQSAKYTDNNTESIRQWQRHYRRQFPTLTFWFDDSVSEKEKDKLRGSLLDLRSVRTSSNTQINHQRYIDFFVDYYATLLDQYCYPCHHCSHTNPARVAKGRGCCCQRWHYQSPPIVIHSQGTIRSLAVCLSSISGFGFMGS